MSKGLLKELDKLMPSQSLIASAMKDRNDKNIDTSILKEKEEEVVSNFDEVVLECVKKPRSIAGNPQKIRVIQLLTREQLINNSRETSSELEATHTEIAIKKRDILESLEHVETVETVKALALPPVLRPKEEKKTVRFTTHVDRKVLENIQYLKANERIQSISSLVTIALIEFIEKYQLMK